jgi:hypothetical protein
MMRDRKLPRIEIRPEAFDVAHVEALRSQIAVQKEITPADARYFVFTDSVKNEAYSLDGFNIKVLFRDGRTLDIAEASDQYNITALANTVTKYFLCYPKNV